MTRNLIELAENLADEGNNYEAHMPCPQCGETYFALFDKMFIDHMGFCYWPCGDSREEVELAANNILEIIGKVLQ